MMNAPSQPTVVASASNSLEFTLSWTNPGYTLTSYEIQCAVFTNGRLGAPFKIITKPGPSDTSLVINNSNVPAVNKSNK